jgi:uncharacterized protein YggT (Ycf19 family)
MPAHGVIRDQAVKRRRPVTVGGPADAAARVVALVIGVVQVLLAARVILLLSVDPDNGLVRFIVSLGEPLVRPVAALFHLDPVMGADGSILDLAALVTLIAWTVVEALLLNVRAGVRRDIADGAYVRARRFLPSP